jgi:hypothetical protein
MLSSNLAQILIAEQGLTPAAARQQISRTKSLNRLSYLKFPNNSRFLYKQEQYKSPWFWDGLRKAVMESGSAYGHAWSALEGRGGVVPKAHFPIISGAPLHQKKHLSQNLILENLIKCKIVEEVDVPGVGACLTLASMIEEVNDERVFSVLRARLITENILLKAVRTWAKNLGIASYGKILIRDEVGNQPKVGTFAWDLSGPSYLSPMISWDSDKIKPGFLTCDVLLGRRVKVEVMNSFINKCTTLKSLKKVGRALHLFIADDYFTEAFNTAKKNGIIATTPDALFGREVAEGLKELSILLKQVVLSSPQILIELFDKLSTIQGAATNLSGALFEFMVAHLVHKKTGATIHLNRMFKRDKGNAEVDVIAVKGDRSIYFIECKGYQPGGTIPDDQIDKWLEKTIPIVRSEALNHPEWKDFQMHFEFWTTGRFTESSLSKLSQAKLYTKKYAIDFKNADEVLAYANDVKDASLLKTLKAHFLEHPLAKVDSHLVDFKNPAAPVSTQHSPNMLVIEPNPEILLIPKS